MSSWTGLPSITPQVALRVADPGRVVQRQHGVQPGQPGRDELRPAAEAGEEVRLDEAGRDPHVGLDPVAVEPDRDAVAVLAEPDRASRVVAGVVVDDPHACRRPRRRASRRSSASVLPRWVPVATRITTSSRSDDAVELRRAPPGSSGGAAAAGCRRTSRSRPSARACASSRSGGPATGSRSAARSAASGRRRPRVDGLHDRRALLRQLDVEPVLAVRQPDLHCGQASRLACPSWKRA